MEGEQPQDVPYILDLFKQETTSYPLPLDSILAFLLKEYQDAQKYTCVAGNNDTSDNGSEPSCPISLESTSLLQKFNNLHLQVRDTKAVQSSDLYKQVFSALLEQRLDHKTWLKEANDRDIFETITALRLVIRDTNYLKQFCHRNGAAIIKEWLHFISEQYMFQEIGESPTYPAVLKALTNICQKMSTQVEFQDVITASNMHEPLLSLLGCPDMGVQQSALYCIASLCKWVKFRNLIQRTAVDPLFLVLQENDLLSKKIACNILRLLCAESEVREEMKNFDGLPILLSLLQSQSLSLKWNVMWMLVQLTSRDAEICKELWCLGGVPLLLKLLNPKMEDSSSGHDELTGSPPADKALRDDDADSMNEEAKLNVLSTQSAVCLCLSELTTNLTIAQHIRQANGFFIIGQHILPNQESSTALQQTRHFLQGSASRALRFLFSIERNRPQIRRIFTPDLLEVFISIGHYKRDAETYQPFLDKLNGISEEVVRILKSNLQSLNHDVTPMFQVNEYDVLEHIGSGAFGSVYKVKKQNGQLYAMKEIRVLHPMFGRTNKERDESVGQVISEINIVRQQLRHPNIVRYYKVFTENEKLYVVMELIDGVSLAEHISSLREKKETFQETTIWYIFVQIILALRYLHKEKRIIHRDLTPNNIMLSERNQITITDFGLARQKRSEYSKMTSMVGTLVYNCPEVIQNHPYGEKADVWSAGCILYLMCTLDPPFTSNNVLALATKIVEGVFKPICEKEFTPKLIAVAHKCLTVKPEDRPDIIGVAKEMVDVVMEYTDKLLHEQNEMEKRMIRENQRFPTQTKFLQISDPYSSTDATISSTTSSRSKGDEKSSNVDSSSAGAKEKPMLNEEGGDVTGTFSTDSKSSTSNNGTEKRLTPALLNLPVKKITEISDPVLKVLQQIRKLVFASQTFSSGQELNAGRTLVIRYKSMLFSPNISTAIVKSELCKLVSSSCQTVELLNSCPRLIHEAVHELHVHSLKVILEDATKDKPAPRESQLPTIITYDQLCTIIENLVRIASVPLQ